MNARMGVLIALCITALAVEAAAQAPQGNPNYGRTAAGGYPNATQPPRTGVAPPAQPMVPFQLSQQELAYLDGVLRQWEAVSGQVKNLQADFYCFQYNGQVDQAGSPVPGAVLQGKLQYAAPDRGRYEIVGQLVPVDVEGKQGYTLKEGVGAARWISDGQAIYNYDFTKKEISKMQLPAEYRGQAISQGPLPFVFGAKANDLMSRYFMRISTPPNVPQAQSQVWIDAWPRQHGDADQFRHAEVILDRKTFQVIGLKMYHLDGKDSTVWNFSNVNVNRGANPIAAFFGASDPFKISTPQDWVIIPKPFPGSSAGRPMEPITRQ